MAKKPTKTQVTTDQLMDKLFQKYQSAPHVADICEAIVNEFGGAANFAHQYYKEFERTDKGSVARGRLLDGVLQLLKFSAQSGFAAKEEDIGMLTDEDLKNAIADATGELRHAEEDAQAEPGGHSETPGDGTRIEDL